MSFIRFAAIALLSMPFVAPSQAQDMPSAHDHAMHAAPKDVRQAVQFPPVMQTNFLANMRDHLDTINSIVQALSSSDLELASRIAAERLGLDSPSAAGCKPKEAAAPLSLAAATSKPKTTPAVKATPAGSAPSMDEMMAQYMPDPMRSMGLSMHSAASDFAVAAKNASATRDTAAAITALSRVTQSCVACHSTYRLR